MRNAIRREGCYVPDRDGVMAKSKLGSSAPAAIGIVTTLYAIAQDKF